MAARSDASTDKLSTTTSIPGSSIITVTCWAYPVASTATWTAFFDLPTSTQQNCIGIDNTYTNIFYNLFGDSPHNITTVSLSTWYRMALVLNGTAVTAYAGAAGAALSNFTGTQAQTPDQIILFSNAVGEFFNGRLANVKVYGAALTAAEVEQELSVYVPQRTANLSRWHPFTAAPDLVDYSGNGFTLTAGSTATTLEDGPPIPWDNDPPRLWAYGPALPVVPTLLAGRGTVANATAGTTSSVTLSSPTSIAVGNYLIARVAVDNSGSSGAAPGCTVTDPRSNTWTVLGPALADPGAAAAGAAAYLCYAKVATAYQAADALTFNWGGISTTAKAVVVEEWTNIHPTAPVAVTATTNDSVAAASTTAVTVSITPTAANQLVYTCLATEGIAADTVGADADTTNGLWMSLDTTASANATATNNQRVSGQYKVVTASGAQSWDSTITSRDWAAVAVVFAPPPVAVPPVPPPHPTFVRQAVGRASNW